MFSLFMTKNNPAIAKKVVISNEETRFYLFIATAHRHTYYYMPIITH